MLEVIRNIFIVIVGTLIIKSPGFSQGLIQTANDSLTTFDVWGFEDATTGSEYAIIGHRPAPGVSIYNVDDPYNPFLVAFMDTIPGFDMKVWNNYLYTVGSGIGTIIDISDPTNPVNVGNFPNAHNLFIDEVGFLFAECPKLTIYNLNNSPTQPVVAWADTSSFSGCHDATVIGDRLFDFHGVDGTFIYDVTDRYNPVLVSIIDRPTIGYHHSGWTTEDGNFLFITDEAAKHPTSDITIWDISDIGNPVLKAEIADSLATVHNIFIIDDFAYVSYYTSGIKVYNVSNPENPVLADEFDTLPDKSGEGFDGAFGIYPFTTSGAIYVSDMSTGFHVFAFDPSTNTIQNFEEHDINITSHPNPSFGKTIINFVLPAISKVEVCLFDVTGKKISTLTSGIMDEGNQQIKINLSHLPSGVYFVKLKIGEAIYTQQIVRI